MFNSTDLYVDLGTTNTLIYARGKGFILNEPSVISLKHYSQKSSQLVASGMTAKRMLGKNPNNLSVLRPLKEGVIADFESTSRMLHSFIKDIKDKIFWLKPRLIISLPCQVTHFEKKSVEEVGYSMGARKVHLIDEPMAAAIGAGLPVVSNRGSMIVDIGGGTTEIAVISMGGIITAQAVRIGGNSIDSSVTDWLSTNYRFAVGEQTAEIIKLNVASALPGHNAAITVGGIDLTTSLPKRFEVTSTMIYPAVNIIVNETISAIKKALSECPPEISSDIATQGLVLAGGGALIHGLAARITQEVGLPVHMAKNPLYSVALGGARALENNQLFNALERPA